MKTKLGVSAELVAAFAFIAAFLGGYIPAFLIAGYVLIVEEDEWLKKAVLKAVAILALFGLCTSVIRMVPEFLGWIDGIANLFEGDITYGAVTRVVNVLVDTLDLIRSILFICLAFLSLKKKSITIPFIDSLINKFTGTKQ